VLNQNGLQRGVQTEGKAIDIGKVRELTTSLTHPEAYFISRGMSIKGFAAEFFLSLRVGSIIMEIFQNWLKEKND